MSNKKPNIIPSKGVVNEVKDEVNNMPDMSMIDLANQTGTEIAKQFELEQKNINLSSVSETEQAAIDTMRLNTERQVAERTRILKVQEDRANALEIEREKMFKQKGPVKKVTPPTPPTPPAQPFNVFDDSTPEEVVDRYYDISQPQMNSSFDLIPLPSKGKTYRNSKESIKVAYMTAADENIMTNPNLMESGEFLEILLNRKILEPSLRYKDLLVGDRNAIMIWLRATGYGHEYPITVYDPSTAEPFEHIVDLSELKTITLDVDTDENGYIDFILPLTGKRVKLKLLTVRDVDDIEKHVSEKLELKNGTVDTVTFTLEKQIVEIDGNNDKDYIRKSIQSMRVGDSNAIRKYIDQIDSGIDMELEIGTPGGESLKTFLPINFKFFWPNL